MKKMADTRLPQYWVIHLGPALGGTLEPIPPPPAQKHTFPTLLDSQFSRDPMGGGLYLVWGTCYNEGCYLGAEDSLWRGRGAAGLGGGRADRDHRGPGPRLVQRPGG